MKIISDSEIAKKKVVLTDILTGTVFSGKIGDRKSTFLKAYDSIVDLLDPEYVWNVRMCRVSEYRELHATLHVTEK